MLGSLAPRSSEGVAYRPLPSRPADAIEHRTGEVVPFPSRMAGASQARRPAARDDKARGVELCLLGGFRLLLGGELVQVGRTGQRLLAVLACRGRQASRGQIAHALWPDTTSARAHANLRTALYRLCRSAPGAVHATSSYLQLAMGIRVDLEHSTRLATRVLAAESVEDPSVLTEALRANFSDDLLPDWDDDWLADHQYRYRQLRLTTLETLSQQLAAAGHHGAAVHAALTAVQADPLRDSAHETLIRACLAQGNRHEAFTHYTTYRRILRDELGLDPPTTLGHLLTSA